jgi:hypothetical protein
VRLLALFLASTLTIASAPAGAAISPDLDGQLQRVISRYVTAIHAQQQAMLGTQMELDIEGNLRQLEKRGRMKVMRMISRLGEISFDLLGSFAGDDTVRKELITRYLSEEQQKKAVGAIDVSPSVYDFRIKAILTEKAGTPQAKTLYVFEVNPRQKAAGLFRGEVQIDGATGMPLRESGQLVESPHFMLKKVRFARDYELVDGVSVLRHMESTVDVRLFGPAELRIEFTGFTRLPAERASAGGF